MCRIGLPRISHVVLKSQQGIRQKYVGERRLRWRSSHQAQHLPGYPVDDTVRPETVSRLEVLDRFRRFVVVLACLCDIQPGLCIYPLLYLPDLRVFHQGILQEESSLEIHSS